MKNTLFGLIFFVFATANYAKTPSQNENQFCIDRKDHGYYQKILLDYQNTLAFRNQGGLINGGVWWWHSRFPRNATYLAIYKPNLPKPNAAEAKKIIKLIRKAEKIVIIPGYKNLYDFSYEYENEIQEELEDWQKASGTIGFQWIKGLAGSTKKNKDEFKKNMDELYKRVNLNKDIVYQKLQIEGIMAHAWLVTRMDKTQNGYLVYVIDSNYQGIMKYQYKYGMESFSFSSYGEFMNYTNFDNELSELKKTVAKYCEK